MSDPRKRRHPEASPRLGDLLGGLEQVQVNLETELIREQADLPEALVADGVGCVRGERRGDQGIVLPLIVDRDPFVDVFIRRPRPGARKLDQRQSHHRAKAESAVGRSEHVGEK